MDPSPALLRRAPSPLGEGCYLDLYPSPLGRGCPGMSGRVRGLFAGDTFMAMDVCEIGDSDGALMDYPRPCTLQNCVLAWEDTQEEHIPSLTHKLKAIPLGGLGEFGM